MSEYTDSKCKICQRMSNIRKRSSSCHIHRPKRKTKKFRKCADCRQIAVRMKYTVVRHYKRNIVYPRYYFCTGCNHVLDKNGEPLISAAEIELRIREMKEQ